jgi:hypothetical protein
MSRRTSHFAPLALLVVAGIAACGRDDRSSAAPAMSEPMAAGEISRADAVVAGKAVAAPPAPMAMERGQNATPSDAAVQQGAAPSTAMIIRNGVASVQVDSLELAISAVQRIAASLGGWVGNTSLSAGEHEIRSATIELKIPAARFDEALAGLKPIGTVESVNSTAEDVGEEFVDLSARTANARRLEARLITLLATRTGKLEDVLNVERELARVREEIDRYEGRLRYLRARVATSTLVVTVHERAPLVSPTPGESVIGEAFKDAWRNFVRFVAAFIASLGTVIPLLVLAGLGVMGWRRFRRRRGAPTTGAGTSA